MTERQDQVDGDALAVLRAHTQRLAGDLPGSLHRLSVSSGDATIEVEWQRPAEVVQGVLPHVLTNGVHVNGSHPNGAHENGHQVPAELEEEQVESVVVSSPMVGTVYRAASPDKPPYVELGDTVEQGQTVAIVEAMKLFNPIVSDAAGVVLEVLVEDGQSVEFGQPLLRLGTSVTADTVNGHE
ncbi:acetyl-CoA carboxylase biotin carboxyl carrier protein [Amycolatopsis nigrescens]|uniref:acetyl-CoA carboxylase biotin carboxyl carrier protein n=1 Tax=Amycolatopsis nigrescens TaxID=381445 RepID=UPI0003785E6B|nr:acetyl-CoA carboxylase biotin carboxyl carrier protein [Amycolatopsis nigrescens]